jgi:outer membrane cobalamin receptor
MDNKAGHKLNVEMEKSEGQNYGQSVGGEGDKKNRKVIGKKRQMKFVAAKMQILDNFEAKTNDRFTFKLNFNQIDRNRKRAFLQLTKKQKKDRTKDDIVCRHNRCFGLLFCHRIGKGYPLRLNVKHLICFTSKENDDKCRNKLK